MIVPATFIGDRSTKRADAVEVEAFNREVLVAKVQGQLLGDVVTDTAENLPGEAGVVIVEAVGRVGADRAAIVDAGDQVVGACIHLGETDTGTEVRLDSASAVEVVDAVEHQVIDVDFSAATSLIGNVRSRWNRQTEAGRVLALFKSAETVTEGRFQAEAIVEAVTQTDLSAIDAAVGIGGTSDRIRNIWFTIVIQRTFEGVAEISTAIPSVLGICDSHSRRHGGCGCRAHKSSFHTHPLL